MATPSTDEWAVLSLHRFILAMIVLLGHISVLCRRDDWTYVGLWLNQGSAVYGFLLISGYSIAASLRKRPQGFRARRLWRIYPLYVCTVLIAMAMYLFIPNPRIGGCALGRPTLLEAVVPFLFLQGIVAGSIPVIGQIWTLSVEWWCYMLAPLFMRRAWLSWTVAIGSYFYYFCYSRHLEVGFNVARHGASLSALAWMWLSGFMFHRMANRKAAMFLLVAPGAFAAQSGIFTGVPFVATMLLLLVCRTIPVSRCLRPSLNWLGDLSYPLYLSHSIVLAVMTYAGIAGSLSMTMMALAFAAVLLHLVDYPTRRRRGLTEKVPNRRTNELANFIPDRNGVAAFSGDFGPSRALILATRAEPSISRR